MLNLVPRGFSMVQVGLALGQGMPSRIRYWWPLTNLILDRAITAAVLGLLFGYAYRTARSQLRTLKDKDGGIQHT
jgi:NhaP-type Na+/H+ or K+/H+ antiporter